MHKPTGWLPKLKWTFFRLLPNHWVRVSLKTHKKQLALSFDDGPHPEYTPQILDLLDRHQVKATFFLIGDNIKKYPEIAASIVEKGHMVANHSFNHRAFIKQPLAEQLKEIQQTEMLLTTLDGRQGHGFRPPNGHLNLKLFFALIKAGITIELWSLNSLDYLYKNVDQLVSKFDDQTAVSGDVVLLHDDSLHTVQSLDVLIPKWRSLGFSFVSYR